MAIVAVLAGVLLVATAGPASAAAPCWKKVALDWADNGSIDKTYPLECYQQAINHQTADVSMYSSFEDDVRRAMQRVIANQHDGGDGTVTVAQDQSTSSDDGVPTPLIVLGGVAIALVAVGAVGLLRRRGRDSA